MAKHEYGAAIERGEIIQKRDDGYVVRSITRDGVITPAMEAMGGKLYEIGDKVAFFMFEDGKGKILTGI